MEVNTTSPIFANFNNQITQTQQPNNKTVPKEEKNEKVLNKQLVRSLIAMGIAGVASLGIYHFSKKRKMKLKYQAPIPKYTAPPPSTHLKEELELYLPSFMPKKPDNIEKTATEYIDDLGRTVKRRVLQTGTIEETFHPEGELFSRRIVQTIKRKDGFSDKLDVFSVHDSTSKKIMGKTTKDVGYGEIEIHHIKEYLKDAKGKLRLIRRQKMEVDDILNPIHKIVEHLEDGTTKITLKNVSNNTQDIITRDRKGNILSQTFTFL